MIHPQPAPVPDAPALHRPRHSAFFWVAIGVMVLAMVLSVVAVVTAVAGRSSSSSSPEPTSLANTCVRSGYSGHYVEVRCYLNDGTSFSKYTLSPAEARSVAPRIVGDLPRSLR
jgi:hypothetical protein